MTKIKIIPIKNWIVSEGKQAEELELIAGVEIEVPERFIPSLETEGVINLEGNKKILEVSESKLPKLSKKTKKELSDAN